MLAGSAFFNVVVDTAQGVHSGFDGGHDVDDVVAGEDFSFRRGGAVVAEVTVAGRPLGMEWMARMHSATSSVPSTATAAVEVDGTEVRAHNVSVDLLAHAFEGDGVHQGVLATHRSWWWMQ